MHTSAFEEKCCSSTLGGQTKYDFDFYINLHGGLLLLLLP